MALNLNYSKLYLLKILFWSLQCNLSPFYKIIKIKRLLWPASWLLFNSKCAKYKLLNYVSTFPTCGFILVDYNFRRTWNAELWNISVFPIIYTNVVSMYRGRAGLESRPAWFLYLRYRLPLCLDHASWFNISETTPIRGVSLS